MSRVKFKLEIHCQLDTDEYPVPSDGNLSLQLKEDVQEALESNIPVEVNSIKAIRTGIKNDEATGENFA
jgi:hypothetical protein